MDQTTVRLRQASSGEMQPGAKLHKSWDKSISFRALFEQTGECIFIIGLDFRYITANQQALSLLGYQEEELVGKPVDEVLSQETTIGKGLFADHHSHVQERVLKCKEITEFNHNFAPLRAFLGVNLGYDH